MKVRFLGGSGIDKDSCKGKRRSPHYDNLEYLDNNPKIKIMMTNALKPYFNNFFNNKPYLNSGKVSIEVCKTINLPDDQFHHGLVGSLIYDTFFMINPEDYGLSLNAEVIASKGEDQHFVDYFMPN